MGAATMPAGGASAADALVASCRARLGPIATFLPQRVPVIAGLAGPFAPFRAAADELPDRYHQPASGVRAWLDGLFGDADPAVQEAVRDAGAATKAGLSAVLSFLVHTYRWDTATPAVERFYDRELVLPAGIRGPWGTLCDELDLPHVGTAWSFILCNWRVRNRQVVGEDQPYDAVSLADQDLGLGCAWLKPPARSSLEHFNLAFLSLEAKGSAAVRHAVAAVAAAEREDIGAVAEALSGLAGAIEAMGSQLVERIRSSRVALEGWLDLIQPTFAWGLPGPDGRSLAGPGGMQLPSLHVIDAALRVPGGSTIGKATRASRPYIPSPHREFLAHFDSLAPHLGEFVVAGGSVEVKRLYNDALRALRHFRVAHRVQGARYLRAGGKEGQPRMSSGTGISWREDPTRPEVEPADQFEREMLDRIVETTDALLPGAGEPPELRAPETSFRFLDRRQLRELLKRARRRSFEPGAVIISAGNRSEAMYLLVEGTALVMDIRAPHAPPVRTLWPGDLFGELSFLGAVPSKSVVAVDHVLVDAFDGDLMQAILAADVPLAAAFYRSLAVLVARRLNQEPGSGEWLGPVDDAGLPGPGRA